MEIIAVSSFKGGTGKTSTAMHIAADLVHRHRKRVLLIDFDAQGNLTTGLGFDPDSHDSLAPVLQGEASISGVILSTCLPGLDLIPADTWLERVEVRGALAADRYSHEKLSKLLSDLDYDFIIIDTPPSLCWLTESALIAAHHTLVCAMAEFYSVKGLERLSQFIHTIGERHPLKILGVLLSFWNSRGKSNETFAKIIEETFPGKIFQAKVRRDIAVSEASIYGKPLMLTAPNSRALIDYSSVTDEILERLCEGVPA